MLIWPQICQISSAITGASVGCSGQTSLINGGPTSQLTVLKGSVANIGARYHRTPQGSSGDHDLTGQSLFVDRCAEATLDR